MFKQIKLIISNLIECIKLYLCARKSPEKYTTHRVIYWAPGHPTKEDLEKLKDDNKLQ